MRRCFRDYILYDNYHLLGAKYIGEHVMDARTGYGKIIYKDGAEFEGYWKDGQLTDPIETTTSEIKTNNNISACF